MQGSVVALDGEVEPITLGYPRLPKAFWTAEGIAIKLRTKWGVSETLRIMSMELRFGRLSSLQFSF